MTDTEAVAIMARVVLASGIRYSDWESYPEIGEHDWERVIDRAVELAHGPSAEKFKEAYDLLTARAAASKR